jgi:hypothetical protein
MVLGKMLEPLMRRAWGRRWNAVARAEAARHFGRGAIGAVIAWGFLAHAAVAAFFFWSRDLRLTSAVARGVLWLGWLIAAVTVAKSVQNMFTLDRELGVTDQWLLTPAGRRDLLWSRVAGRFPAGPAMVLALAPLYFLGAVGLSGAQYPLFALGHLARLFACVPAETRITAAGVAAGVPVALLAMASDISLCLAMGGGSLTGALNGISLKRLFREPGRALGQSVGLTVRTTALGLCGLSVDGVCAVASGLWCIERWEGAGPTLIGPGLGLAVGLTVVAMAARLVVTAFTVGVAGDYHDPVLLESDPNSLAD